MFEQTESFQKATATLGDCSSLEFLNAEKEHCLLQTVSFSTHNAVQTPVSNTRALCAPDICDKH